MGGFDLMTLIVTKEQEVVEYDNLTDTVVTGMLDERRKQLNSKAKCPFCRNKLNLDCKEESVPPHKSSPETIHIRRNVKKQFKD